MLLYITKRENENDFLLQIIFSRDNTIIFYDINNKYKKYTRDLEDIL